jgi:hypothetical protein
MADRAGGYLRKNMPKIGGCQSFNMARRTMVGFEAML